MKPATYRALLRQCRHRNEELKRQLAFYRNEEARHVVVLKNRVNEQRLAISTLQAQVAHLQATMSDGGKQALADVVKLQEDLARVERQNEFLVSKLEMAK
jgi:hypothetical protein